MRLHRNLVFAVIDSLLNIFNEGEYADKEVAKALKRDTRWGAKDRKFVQEVEAEAMLALYKLFPKATESVTLYNPISIGAYVEVAKFISKSILTLVLAFIIILVSEIFIILFSLFIY